MTSQEGRGAAGGGVIARAWGWFRKHPGWSASGLAMVLLAVGLGAAGQAGMLGRMWGSDAADQATHVVERGPMSISLREDGELKPLKSVDIKCEVQGQAITIQFIVDESTRVKAGDLLVKLASDEIRDRVEMDEIEIQGINNALEDARRSLEITQSENSSRIQKAEIDLKLAELELQRYMEGDYKKSVQVSDITIKQTQMDIEKKKEEYEKNKKLLDRQFVTASKVEELKNDWEKAEMTLEMNQLERQILETYELSKNKMQKETAVDQARDELQREHQRSEAREKQAQAKVRDQEQTLEKRQKRFERLKEQLAKCEIHSPIDGVVRYGDSHGERMWGGNRIAVGERVYDGQTLMNIPDANQLLVSTRVHEADRHKLREGLPCIVRVPAVPDYTFSGTLSKIAKFADSERSWWNPDLKEHAAEIMLDETDSRLSPGDSAHVDILIEEVADVLAVPVQCIFTRGSKRYAFVQRGGGTEAVEIEVNRSSTTMTEVTSGLAAGDRVLMAPGDDLLATLPTPRPGTDELEANQARQAQAASQPSSG